MHHDNNVLHFVAFGCISALPVLIPICSTSLEDGKGTAHKALR